MSILGVLNSLPWLFWVSLGAGVGAGLFIGWGAGGVQSVLYLTRLMSGWVVVQVTGTTEASMGAQRHETLQRQETYQEGGALLEGGAVEVGERSDST